MILYGGLELEGRMTDLLVELASRRRTVAVTKDIPREELLEPAQFEGKYDPHVWFDVSKWQSAARTIAATFKEIDAKHAADYDARLRRYLRELEELDRFAKRRFAAIPRSRRVLVTSHDAFNYLGRRYGLDVVAIQGISTAAEATTADIKRVANVIAQRRVGASSSSRAFPGRRSTRSSRRRRARASGPGSAARCTPTPRAARGRRRAPTSGWSATTSR